jgi:hypothetical protein
MFEASTYPSLAISLEPHLNTIGSTEHFKPLLTFGVYRLSVNLKNLSSNTSIAETKYSIQAADVSRGWRLWQKKWLLYDSGEGRIIGPLSKDTIESRGSIEGFLLANMPGLIRKIEMQQRDEARRTTSYYSPIGSYSLRLLLTVKYKPGVTGANFRKVSKSYRLLPNPQHVEGLPDNLFDWKIEEIS